MNEDFKTKILIEKSKQENKANLLFKYVILLFFAIAFLLIFLIFKEHFFNYFNKYFSSKNKLEEVEIEQIIIKEKDIDQPINNEEINIDISLFEECRKYKLTESQCEISSLYQIALKKFNEESEKIFSNKSIKEIYPDQFKKLLDLKQSSLQNFTNNFFKKAYIDIKEAEKISYSIIDLSKKAYKENMASANEAYLKRDQNAASLFLKNAEKYSPESSDILLLKGRVQNISQIIQLEKKIEEAIQNKNVSQEIDLIERIKSLDNYILKYDSRLSELISLEKEKEFNNIVLEVQEFIKNNKMNMAKKKLILAEKIYPKNKMISALKADINNLEKINKISFLKKEINKMIINDEWVKIEKKYEEILLLDNTNYFAVDGLKVAKKVNSLMDKIKKLNKEPLLLTKTEYYDEASFLLKKASSLNIKSSELSKNISILNNNLDLAKTPSIVNLKSDNNTHIIIRKIGIVGKTYSKTLKLKAGKYIFEGKRDGYKTILVEKNIDLDEKLINLEVICNEPI